MVVNKSLNDKDGINRSSDKSFGILFGFVFLIIALWPIFYKEEPLVWAIITSIVFFVIVFIKPVLLARLNFIWFKFGQFLHKIMSPLILAFIFFSTIMPIGLIMQLCGKRPLPLIFDETKNSYWIDKTPIVAEPATMKRQF
jgi:hypothetical protein